MTPLECDFHLLTRAAAVMALLDPRTLDNIRQHTGDPSTIEFVRLITPAAEFAANRVAAEPIYEETDH